MIFVAWAVVVFVLVIAGLLLANDLEELFVTLGSLLIVGAFIWANVYLLKYYLF